MTVRAAGVLLFCMVGLSLLSDIFAIPFYLAAGLCSWLAVFLLLPTIGKLVLGQAGIIVLLGMVMLVLAAHAGADIDYAAVVSKNAGLITMIASVGFLRLIAVVDSGSEPLPVGASAFFKTLLGVSVFGSVINISAPILFADRLHAENRLSRLASSSLTRVFSGCSAWSPFFGGMAAVVTYVPDVQLPVLMACCLPFALMGLLVVCLDAGFLKRQLLSEFYGYPVQFRSLWIPVMLSLLVAGLSVVAPDWSVLTSISVAALVLTFATLVVWYGIGGWHRITQHVLRQLPAMGNELFLFLAAGVLAQGLSSLISSGLLSMPLFHFGALQAVALLFFMVVIGAIGVHPVIFIAGITPLILMMEPNDNLLGIVYLLAWSLGTCASPLSGTHLVFQGRYGIPSWRGAIWNWPYVGVMLLISVPYLIAVAVFL